MLYVLSSGTAGDNLPVGDFLSEINRSTPGEPSFTQDKTIIYFDGVCLLCISSVAFLVKRITSRNVLFATLQGQTAETRLPEELRCNLDSIIIASPKKIDRCSTAAIRALILMGGLWKIAYVLLLVPRFFRDFIYIQIAKRRYDIFGKKNSCYIPSHEEKERFLD